MTETTAAVPTTPAPTAAAPTGGFSPDRAWWWDGERWVPTITADGRWRWDGQSWQMNRHLDLANPAAAQADLLATADDLFAQAGALASQRRMEWAVPADLFPVLQALDAATVTMNSRRGRDQQQAAAQVHAIAADLGRRITAGALPEVAALLDLARRQIAIANSLATAASALDTATAEHDAATAEGRSRLATAEQARTDAVTGARSVVAEAEAARTAALAEQRARVKALRAPGPGAELARFGAIVLYARVVDTPEGRGLVEGAKAAVLSVEELFASRRALVDSLTLLGGYAGSLLVEADWTWPGHAFLLVESAGVASIVPVADAELEAARAFAAEVAKAAGAAAAARAAEREAVGAAESELARSSASSDTSVEAARARLAKVEADPKLLAAVEAAQAALAAAEADTAAIDAAREKIEQAGKLALEPPPPLGGAAA